MSASVNPDIVTDGLVLCLDAGNGDCFRGESTTNVVKNSIPTTGWFVVNSGGSAGTINFLDDEDIPYMRISNLIFSGTSYPRIIDELFTGTVTGNVTFSFEARGTVDSILNVSLYASNSTKHTFTVILTEEWTKYTYSVNSIHILNQPYFQPRTTGATMDFRNIQVENKPYATQFVNGARGSTVATGGGLVDLSGNNNHGTIVRASSPTAAFYNESNKGSLVFNGSNDYIETSNLTLDLTNGFTISQWFKATSASSTTGIFAYRNDLNNVNIILLTNYSIRLESYDTGGQLYSAASVFELNKWYNVVCTFSGTDTPGSSGISNIYLNGISIASGSRNGFDSTTAKVIIGTYSGGYFNGQISNTMFYNTTLTPKQIMDNYKALKGRYGL